MKARSSFIYFFNNWVNFFVHPGWSRLGDHFVLESIAHWVWAHFWPLQQVFRSTRKKLSNNFTIFILVDLISIHYVLCLKSAMIITERFRFFKVASTASVLNDSLNNVPGLREWNGLAFTHICVALSPVSAHCEAIKLQLWSSGLLSLLRGISNKKVSKNTLNITVMCRSSLMDNSKPNPVF